MELPIVGAAEIAEMLGGYSRQRVSQFTSGSDFPVPYARLRMGSVWRYDDVTDWAQKHAYTIHPLTVSDDRSPRRGKGATPP